MPLLSIESVLELAACPVCRSGLQGAEQGWVCTGCAHEYSTTAGARPLPILVDGERSVVDVDGLRQAEAPSVINRSRGGRLLAPLRRLVQPRNTTAERTLQRLVEELVAGRDRRPRVLVVGGGSVGNGAAALYDDPRIDVLGFDIYPSPIVQLVADAHSIPLLDGCVDGVVVQAVLEHVLEPTVVVQEIHRVLSPQGLVYADTPFMQQVHEAAYDFTRFTESGHRYLFRRFTTLDRGVVAGLGTQLRWSLDYFARGLFRSQAAGRVVRLLFFWLSRLDTRLGPEATVDGASSVFFYGRRAEAAISPQEAVAGYSGAQ